MNVADFIDPALAPVLVGAAGLGAACGTVGTFALVRRESLQGDAVAHAALPGVALAYLLGGRGDLLLLLGAALTGWLALGIVGVVSRRGPTAPDAALAGALATFFGLGLVLLGYLQRNPRPDGAAPRLQQYLFGAEAATLRFIDLVPLAALAVPAVLLLVAFWKELQLASFDGDFASSIGLPRRWLDLLMTALIVLAVVAGLQTVGVVLVSALIVAPAAAARQWADRLGRVALLAALFGALAGAGGALAGHWLSGPRRPVPTGPAVVLAATLLALLSLLLAPRRGIVARYVRSRRVVPPAGVV